MKKTYYHHMVVLIHGYLGSSREQEYLGEALFHQLERITNHGDDDDDDDHHHHHNDDASSSSSSFVEDTTTNDDDVDNCQTTDRNHHHHRPTHKFAILNSKANMVDSTDGIVKGGERLAVEITEWVRRQTDEVVRQQQQQSEEEESIIMTLSMVGNSLGGLYGRYALTELTHIFRNDNSCSNNIHKNDDSNNNNINNNSDDRSNNESNNNDNNKSNPPRIIPLIFCTTSSPHLGVSRETFVELPRWTEPYVSSAFRQRTMDDLFRVNGSTVVMDMCRRRDDNYDGNNSGNKDEKDDNNPSDDGGSSNNNNNGGGGGSGGGSSYRSHRSHREYLRPLGQFRKRIAVANAYNTDFLVSVSSGAFLSSESDSIHYHLDSDVTVKQQQSLSLRLMKDIEHVALQVVTLPEEDGDDDNAILPTSSMTGRDKVKSDVDDHDHDDDTSHCVNALDRLGWHKIFIDTRNLLPNFLNLPIPALKPANNNNDKASRHEAYYTSGELRDHFQRYGTLLPVAHPLNMANSRTDWYRKLTKGGQPIVDALAELLVLDMIEFSEKIDES